MSRPDPSAANPRVVKTRIGVPPELVGRSAVMMLMRRRRPQAPLVSDEEVAAFWTHPADRTITGNCRFNTGEIGTANVGADIWLVGPALPRPVVMTLREAFELDDGSFFVSGEVSLEDFAFLGEHAEHVGGFGG